MSNVTVLSPHRDDAVFSLQLSLTRWKQKQVSLHVVNVFTRSAYAPGVNLDSLSEDKVIWLASRARLREDRKALRAIDRNLEMHDLGELDAPIRLHIPLSDIRQGDTNIDRHRRFIGELAQRLRPFVARGLMLAPLAIGNHVDHLIVRSAGIQATALHRLAFYEDLPYAGWVQNEDILRRVSDTVDRTGHELAPAIIRNPNAISLKVRSAATYASQIQPELAREIANFAHRYGGGERLWIPRHNRTWTALVS